MLRRLCSPFRHVQAPVELPADIADESGAELIIIGLRRRSAVGKFLLGSIAQRILLEAHCDVLAVKP